MLDVTKDDIKKAASLKGMKISAFVLDAVQKELERMKK